MSHNPHYSLIARFNPYYSHYTPLNALHTTTVSNEFLNEITFDIHSKTLHMWATCFEKLNLTYKPALSLSILKISLQDLAAAVAAVRRRSVTFWQGKFARSEGKHFSQGHFCLTRFGGHWLNTLRGRGGASTRHFKWAWGPSIRHTKKRGREGISAQDSSKGVFLKCVIHPMQNQNELKDLFV